MKFVITKNINPLPHEDKFMLRGEKQAHFQSNVSKLLKSETFCKSNPDLVPIFKKAEKMMLAGKIGEVIV